MLQKRNIRLLIARTLRIGVSLACAIALTGGVIYLLHHGSEPMPDYSSFTYGTAPASYTTLPGIVEGVLGFTAYGWIQLGVIVLLLTPVMRVVLSLADFVQERDWLYAAISAVVLAVIALNSFEGALS